MFGGRRTIEFVDRVLFVSETFAQFHWVVSMLKAHVRSEFTGSRITVADSWLHDHGCMSRLQDHVCRITVTGPRVVGPES